LGTTVTRMLAAAVLAAGGILGFAGPAHADQQVLNGVYTYQQDGGLTGDWHIYPTCVPTVGDLRVPLYLPVACHLHVEAFPGVVGGDARMTNGVWTYNAPVREGMQCPDGSWAQTSETFAFNTDTMSGTRTTAHNADCGLQPGLIKTNFTLAYKAPLEQPVTEYPLICEPGGLRRCF
jgi:hypothetical protein